MARFPPTLPALGLARAAPRAAYLARSAPRRTPGKSRACAAKPIGALLNCSVRCAPGCAAWPSCHLASDRTPASAPARLPRRSRVGAGGRPVLEYLQRVNAGRTRRPAGRRRPRPRWECRGRNPRRGATRCSTGSTASRRTAQHQISRPGHHERANRDNRERPRPGASRVASVVMPSASGIVRRESLSEIDWVGPTSSFMTLPSRLPVVTVGPRARLPAGLLHVLTPRTLSVLATRPLWILAARTLRVLTEGDLNARALDRGAPTGGRRLCERGAASPTSTTARYEPLCFSMAPSPDLARSDCTRVSPCSSPSAQEASRPPGAMIGKGRAVASAAKNRRNQGVWLVNHVVNAWSEQPCSLRDALQSHAGFDRLPPSEWPRRRHRLKSPLPQGEGGAWKTYSSAASSSSRWMSRHSTFASSSAPRGTLQGAVSRRHEHLPPGASRDGAIRDCAPARQTREKRPFHAAGRPAPRLPIRALRVERLQQPEERPDMPATTHVTSCPTPCSSGSRNAQPGYDRDNRFFTEDFAEMKQAGYLYAPVRCRASSVAAASPSPGDAEQRRLAYHAHATALGINMHIYWTGVAADLWQAGDKSLDGCSPPRSMVRSTRPATRAGQRHPRAPARRRRPSRRRRLSLHRSQVLRQPHARVDLPRSARPGRVDPARPKVSTPSCRGRPRLHHQTPGTSSACAPPRATTRSSTAPWSRTSTSPAWCPPGSRAPTSSSWPSSSGR